MSSELEPRPVGMAAISGGEPNGPMSESRSRANRPRPTRLGGIALFCGALVLFVATGRTLPSGDNLGTRALAASLASQGSFDLTPAVGPGFSHYSVVGRPDGRIFIAFPAGSAFFAAPIYKLVGLVERMSAHELFSSERLEKGAAAVLAALSVSVLYLSLVGLIGWRAAISAALMFAAGTPVLTTISQGLWSFTGENLALCIALRFLLLSRTAALAGGLSGLAAAMAVFCRPTAVLLATVPLIGFKGRARGWFAAAVSAGLVATFAMNRLIYGSLLGAYGELNAGKRVTEVSRLVENLAGVLVSPSRGLVWFFPLLVFLLVLGCGARSRARLQGAWAPLAGVTTLVVVLTAAYEKWWGGHSLGPRLLSELAIPSAIGFGLLLRGAWSPRVRRLGFVLAAVQVSQFAVLYLSPRASRWSAEVAVDANPGILWSLADGQVLSSLNPGWSYVETGPYFSDEPLLAARSDYSWTVVDLTSAANSRYDLAPAKGAAGPSPGELYLQRLTAEAAPPIAHLRPLPAGGPNLVRVCRGQSSARIDVGGALVRRLDTLILWRGSVTPSQRLSPAGYVELEFSNGKRSAWPLRFGSEILLRDQLDLDFATKAGRIYAGRVSAPDGLQRQRFIIPGKNRSLAALTIGMPEGGADGCLFLLAAALGVPERDEHQSRP